MSKERMHCCTCAQPLSRPSSPTLSSYDFCEKPLARRTPSPQPSRHLPCCGRYICSRCLRSNRRFETYCPFCQITSGPSSLPQGLRDPPAYDSAPPSPRGLRPQREEDDEAAAPPSYDSLDHNASQQAPDVTHHLHPNDTLQSLSLSYKVPIAVLKRHNNLHAEHLLAAHRTISIPGTHYKGGVSLSPKPVDSEEEREQKLKLRRFMTGTKCHEYNVAEVYLREANGDLDRAVSKWESDEKWEREHPIKGKGKAPARGRFGRGGGGLVGQLGLR